MKILGAIVVIAVLAVGGWWLGVKLPAERRAAQAAERAAAEAAVRAQREVMFGPEANAPEVQWRDSGLGYRIETEGTGRKPAPGGRILMSYVGRLKDGTVFDRSKEPTEFRIGAMVPGMSAGAQMLGTGGKGVFFIPPTLGYGGQKVAGIPPNSGLIFEIELVAVNP